MNLLIKNFGSYKMDRIGQFIIDNIFEKPTEQIEESFMQNGDEMDMELQDMYDELFSVLNISKLVDVKILRENYGKQRMEVFTFTYEGRFCEIGEHYGSQRDYFWVTIYPVSN
jgi:hypothetical protein